jgi:hypothetical protein
LRSALPSATGLLLELSVRVCDVAHA